MCPRRIRYYPLKNSMRNQPKEKKGKLREKGGDIATMKGSNLFHAVSNISM